MQATETFKRLDGETDKAIIRTRRTALGFTASVKIGSISRVVTAAHRDEITAFNFASRALMNYLENLNN